jgi:hypothetical protein
MRITARETRTKEKEAGPATGVPPIGRHHNQAIARSGPDTDPHSPFWRQAPSVFAASDTYGRIVPDHRTEIRTNWSLTSLYILFVCPYLELNLKPNPEIAAETYELWNWDVAEVFIGSDFQNIRRYKEFELSPQGEWVDLDIDLDRPRPEEGWLWSSRFEAAARIETSLRIWYGFMRIPYSAIDTRPAAAGNPSGSTTFHVPEMFGTLKLVKS